MEAKAHTSNRVWFGVQVATICVVWYSSSSAQSILNKYALQRYPFPLTIALSSLLNNVLYAMPLIKILHIPAVKISSNYLLATVVPISVGRALAVSSAYFSLWRVPVSYAQTIKSTMPIFTDSALEVKVLLTRLILKERHSTRVYISLIPIMAGVFTVSATELEFDVFGLSSALFSTCVFAYLNVLAKKVFEETGMHPICLLSLNSQLASLLLFPIWVLKDGYAMWSGVGTTADEALAFPDGPISGSGQPDLLFLLFLLLSGLFSFIQNLCAFILIHQLTTLSYAVSNAAKRIFVILLSLLTFRNPVTPLNMCGMLLAVAGVLIYNRTKASEKTDKSVAEYSQLNGHARRDSSSNSIFRRKYSTLDVGQMHSSDSDVRLLLATN